MVMATTLFHVDPQAIEQQMDHQGKEVNPAPRGHRVKEVNLVPVGHWGFRAQMVHVDLLYKMTKEKEGPLP